MSRSFTAITPEGVTVRVRITDDLEPHVMKDGRVLATGIPETFYTDSVPGLRFGELDLIPTANKETRQAVTVTRGDTVLTDVDVLVSIGFLSVPGWPVLWGLRLNERAKKAEGYTYVDGQPTLETWQIDMIPIKRPCCGRR